MRTVSWALVMAILVLGGCEFSRALWSESALFRLVPLSESRVSFENPIDEDNYDLFSFYYLHNGGGISIGDVNGDGLPDLFFTGNEVSSRLYLNEGNFRFRDVTDVAGVATDGWATGTTFVDVNHDGHLDIYVCRAGPLGTPPSQRTNLLFVNDGDGTFTERASQYGVADTSYSTQVAFFDYDKDGDLDLYVLNHSMAFDQPNRPRPIETDGSGYGNDHLYRNDGDGTFADVTREAGIVYPGMGLGVAVNDVNGDGGEDIYVANDFLANDYLYLNNGDGTFRERGGKAMKHHSFSSMGADLADLNNDGAVDIVVLDMLAPDNETRKTMADPLTYDYFRRMLQLGYHPQYPRNTLQANTGLRPNGTLHFSEIGQYAGIDATGWSWAPLVADFDNDGYQDLWVTTNGLRRNVIHLDRLKERARWSWQFGEDEARRRGRKMVEEMPMRRRSDFVFRNQGDWTFVDKRDEWIPARPGLSNGGAYGDLDNDGDLDVVISHMNEPARIYENRSDTSKTLVVTLDGPAQNPNGIGARVRLYCNGMQQLRHQSVTRGYQSSTDPRLHFGLGDCSAVDSLRVVWPDRSTQRLTDVAAGQALTLHYADARAPKGSVSSLVPTQSPNPLLREVTGGLELQYRHEEVPYNDFRRQPLLPHQLSRLGPGMAVGDVNGDGREDVYVGGAFEKLGRLMIQTAVGTFRSSTLETMPKPEEDTGALFFDADGDGDQDLYVASGSNEYFAGSEYYQDRLYRNEGSGTFREDPDALPQMRTSSSTVVATDYDRDGDLDLFVGGRLDPLSPDRPTGYPKPGRSYILCNEDGTFQDVTDRVAPGLKDVGMVTSALWTDFNDDGWIDLIVVGEFMPITFYENREGRLTNVTDQTSLPDTRGWWNSIIGADFDRDGDTDYVAGNLGLNSRYEASPSEPVSVYARDFNGDGRLDPFLTFYLNGREYPAHGRDAALKQIPGMKGTYPTYESYARETFTDIIPERFLREAYTVRATRFESSYLENNGDGTFDIRALPPKAQWAPMYGLTVSDVTGDGILDVLAVGNSYAPHVGAGRLDASTGWLLKGDGAGHFEAVPHTESGLFVEGDGTSLVRMVSSEQGVVYLAAQNDDSLETYMYTSSSRGVQFQPEPLDVYVKLQMEGRRSVKREFYHGSGYLSGSSRVILIPPSAKRGTVYRYDGTARPLPRPATAEAHNTQP